MSKYYFHRNDLAFWNCKQNWHLNESNDCKINVCDSPKLLEQVSGNKKNLQPLFFLQENTNNNYLPRRTPGFLNTWTMDHQTTSIEQIWSKMVRNIILNPPTRKICFLWSSTWKSLVNTGFHNKYKFWLFFEVKERPKNQTVIKKNTDIIRPSSH